MKKLMEKFMMVALVISALVALSPRAFAQTEIFEDTNISITSKLPPQYLGWRVHVGSTTQNIAVYYKVSAVVPGVGETVASPVTTAYTTYAPTSSTNSLRLMWAPVQSATQYKLYKSNDNSTYNLLATVDDPVLTYVDEGASVGAAYSAPSPKGGNLTVENNLTVGKNFSLTGNLAFAGYGAMTPKTKAQIEAITPSQAGQFYACSNCIDAAVCISTGTGVSSWVQISSITAACN